MVPIQIFRDGGADRTHNSHATLQSRTTGEISRRDARRGQEEVFRNGVVVDITVSNYRILSFIPPTNTGCNFPSTGPRTIH